METRTKISHLRHQVANEPSADWFSFALLFLLGSFVGFRKTRVRAISKHRRTDDDRVVVTGMGLVSCLGTDVDEFHEKLCRGTNGIRTIDRFDVTKYATKFGGQIDTNEFQQEVEKYIEKKQEKRLDPFLRYAMVGGKKALEHAGIAPGMPDYEKLDLTKCGIIVGSGMGGIKTQHDNSVKLENMGPQRVSPYFIPHAITNMASGLLAMDTKFAGLNYSVSTACATANFAFTNAANHIRAGDADVILCGGVEAPVINAGLGGFIACRALSERNKSPETASRPWDRNRDGFVIGEGCGVLVFERLSHAKRRGAKIYGEFLGGAFTCDAHHMTEPRQDGLSVSRCIVQALEKSGVDRKQVTLVNCHATSTPAGDIAEIRAVKEAFQHDTDHLVVNGTKSMIGHSLGAAAGIEAISILKAIETGQIHPTRNLENPDPELTIKAPTEMLEREIEVAISNSFGFGGHNSVVAFAPFKD